MWSYFEDGVVPAAGATCWLASTAIVWQDQWLGDRWRWRNRWIPAMGEPYAFAEWWPEN